MMTQFQHTLKALLEGRKTETSRIIKANQLWYPNLGVVANSNDHGWNNRTVWAIGKDYAIEPRRDVRSVGRYRVEAIWRQDVRTLTQAQVKAEGFVSMFEFMKVWVGMHDPEMRDLAWSAYRIDARPNDRYTAWRMKINVLWETIDWNAPAVAALQIEPRTVY
jgi:hypothetical protein